MNRRQTLWLLLGLAPAALAQNRLEIIALRHRTADEVLPVLRPLLEAGGTLSAHGNQLFVRASAANLAELRRVLESVDRPARKLQVSVRFEEAIDATSRSLEIGGRVGNSGARVDVRAAEATVAASERVDQRLQVLEGGRAMIYAGTSRGVPQRQVIRTPAGVVGQETIVIQERATGFEVLPRLSGQRVQLEIYPQREAADRFQRIATTLQASLGEWVEVGGVVATGESRRVFLRVEELN